MADQYRVLWQSVGSSRTSATAHHIQPKLATIVRLEAFGRQGDELVMEPVAALRSVGRGATKKERGTNIR